VTQQPPGNIYSGQATVGTTATPLAPQRTYGHNVTLQNLSTTAVVAIGDASVTMTGFLLPMAVDATHPGAPISVFCAGPIYGRVASGTAVVGVLSTYV
jgi:hypothetical protein